MNLQLIHTALVDAGLKIVGVSADGHVDFDGPATPDDRLLARQVILGFREPTHEEIKARLLADRDRFLDQLLFERFLPFNG